MSVFYRNRNRRFGTQFQSPLDVGGLVVCFLISLVAFLSGGCATSGLDPYFASTKSDANVYVSPAKSGISKIAVLPFKGPTEHVGASVSDMVVTEMLRTRMYVLVERSQMAGVLGETELSLSGLSESRAVEIAKMLGAEAVTIGTVDEYSTQARGGNTYAVVGISMRLIDCGTGQIIWSADLAKMADNASKPLAAHGRAVVHELMSGLYQKLAKQQPSAVLGKAADGQSGRRGAPAPVAQPASPPNAPDGVKVSDMGLREAIVSWTKADPVASKYRIERATSAGGPFKTVGESSPGRMKFTDDCGLLDGTIYYYRVVATGAGGLESKPSAVVESMTAPPPDPPSGVKATAPSSRCVELSWEAPRSEGVNRYRVERTQADAGSEWRLLEETGKTSFVDGGKAGCDLDDSTRYIYRVTAINRVGAVGTPSANVTVETMPPPGRVKDFFAMPMQVRCVPLSWRQSSEEDVIGYEIERVEAETGDFIKLAKINGRDETKYLDGRRDPGNLSDAQVYTYRIRAFNMVGSKGEWSDTVEAETRGVPPPPSETAAVSGLARAVSVSWAQSEDDKVVSYKVQRRGGEDTEWREAGTVHGRDSTSLLDRAGAASAAPAGRLKDGEQYRYRVCAVNTARAVSPWSAEAAAVTKAAPAAPSGLHASADIAGKVVLEWKANPEKDINCYVIESRAVDRTRWRDVAQVENCQSEETGLKPGEERFYRIKAVDVETLESAWSEETRGSARPLPAPPTSLTAEWNGDGVKFAWKPPEGDIKEYRVYRKGLLSSSKISSSTNPSCVMDSKVVGSGIKVCVTAVDASGLESLQSETLVIKPPTDSGG